MRLLTFTLPAPLRALGAAGLAVSCLWLGGCATATPYQSLRDGEGYAEQRLESNRYRVSYRGNGATPRETVENYLMYRAAEVTLNNGYDWFLIADRQTRADAARSGNGVSSGVGIGVGRGSGGFGTGVSIGLGTLLGGNRDAAYDAQADILVFKNPKPADKLNGFDAREVRNNLESTIQRPAAR